MKIKAHLAAGTCLLSSTLASERGKTLLERMGQTPELSDLTTIIHGYPEYANALANLTNVTCFAPSNAAWARFAETHPATHSQLSSRLDIFSAIMDLHVVSGAHYSPEFRPEELWFLHTFLSDKSVTNVSDGQVVKVRRVDDALEVSTDATNPARVTQKVRKTSLAERSEGDAQGADRCGAGQVFRRG